MYFPSTTCIIFMANTNKLQNLLSAYVFMCYMFMQVVHSFHDDRRGPGILFIMFGNVLSNKLRFH